MAAMRGHDRETSAPSASRDYDVSRHSRLRALVFIGSLGILAGAGFCLHLDRVNAANARRAEAEWAEAASRGAALQQIERHLVAQSAEWKEILLGGADRTAFVRHRDAFFQEEKAVREGATHLGEEHPALRDGAAALLRAHDEMGQRYRTGLRLFADSGGADATLANRASAGAEAASFTCLDALFKLAGGRGAAAPIAPFLHATPWLLGALALVFLLVGLAVTRGSLRTAREWAAERDGLARSKKKLALAFMDQAGEVAGQSESLRSSAAGIAREAAEQAGHLATTARTLTHLAATVKQNADSAQQADQLASGARDVAEKGGRVVGDAVAAMAQINESSKQIADIITTIDEIAFQTNLLALNAAVEAARAGEQGRGFAVVATEVRNLAQRSASAAKEIKALIQDSVKKVESGAALVNTSGQTLSEIVTSVQRVTDIVEEIAAASREQSVGLDQVNTAVSEMDAVTQANARATQALAVTAGDLHEKGRWMESLAQQAIVPRKEPSGASLQSKGSPGAGDRLAHAA
ncbi:MAG: methyl-accepting chemotaxis protein [Candidatus Eisenbacteria bacterium]